MNLNVRRICNRKIRTTKHFNKERKKKRFEKKMRKVSNLIFVLLTFCLVLRIQISLAKPDGSPDACATVPGKKTVTY